MATTGSIEVDLNNFGEMVNNSSQLGEAVTGGVSDQGDLIGLAIGLTIAISLLFGVIILLLGVIITLIRKTKTIGK